MNTDMIIAILKGLAEGFKVIHGTDKVIEEKRDEITSATHPVLTPDELASAQLLHAADDE